MVLQASVGTGSSEPSVETGSSELSLGVGAAGTSAEEEVLSGKGGTVGSPETGRVKLGVP